MTALLRTIAIVGGGFSGTVLAANLLRRPPAGPARIVLIERRGEIGQGVAYAARNHPYLLNVPAGRMSATSHDPGQFLAFARRRDPKVDSEDFLPRQLYGEYLQEFLLAAELDAPRHVRLEKLAAEVAGIRRVDRSTPLQVSLADGRTIVADDVVLASGNPPPGNPPGASGVAGHPRYVRDSFSYDPESHSGGTTLLVGTGLTMADAVVAGAERNPKAVFHALSRHGLVPPRQTAFRPDAFKGDGNILMLAASSSLRGLLRTARILAKEAEQQGGDWREAVTFVRNMAPLLWERLSEKDRRRFMRHLRSYWDVHRHRLPPQTVARLAELQAAGRLHIHAGRIQELLPEGRGIRVVWRPRGGKKPAQRLLADWVVNCTGPDYGIERSAEPLFRSLLSGGLAVADPLGLGLKTGPQGAVVDAEGWPGPHLFYVGPMLRASLWEATAVGELRGHAERLAAHLARQ